MNDASILNCPKSETLTALLEGTVENPDLVSAHIDHCVRCQNELEQLSESEILNPFRDQTKSTSRKTDFLDPPLRDGDLGSIGDLAIEQEIGRGGAGIVYRAFDKKLDRTVAVKVLNLDSGHSEARFQRESKAAAGLNSDFLVSVFSIGRTTDGRPYLVMPLIDGQTLKQLLARGMLDARQAATYVRHVARGLQTVHASGLIHRDVKPGNILIDPTDGRAKLTDFGLARSTSNETLTQANVLCGTPEYMSPEQARGQADIDAASDVYSLGVALFECLTGTPPFRGQPIQVLHHHQDTDPVRPSRLNPGVPRDLETICLKAISKAPVQRYQTAHAMSDDLQRFLDGRPIVAKPVPAFVVFWKWCQRNRALAATFGLLLISLLAGTVVSTAMWFRSERNAARAIESDQQSQMRLTQLEKGNEILSSIFDDLNMMEIKQEDKSLESVLSERLVSAGKKLDSAAIGDPLTEAKLRNQLGNSLVSLGFEKESVPLVEKSLEIRRAELGSTHVETLQAEHDLGWAYHRAGQNELALPLFQLAFEGRQKVLGADHPDTMESMAMLGGAYFELGKLDEAQFWLERALEKRRNSLGTNHEDTAYSMTQLAQAYIKAGKIDEAKPLYDQAFEVRQKIFGTDHWLTIVGLNNLAYWAINANRFDQAAQRLEDSLTRLRRKFVPDHPSTIAAINNLAYCYQMQNKLDRAIELYGEMVELMTKKEGEQHPHTLIGMNNLARAYELNNKLDKSIPLFEKTLSIRKASLGEDHPDTLVSMNNLGTVYATSGELQKSSEIFQNALKLKRSKYGDDHIETLKGAANLGGVYKDLDRLDDAIPLLEEACKGVSEYPILRGQVGELMDAYVRIGQAQKAQEIYQKSKGLLSDPEESENITLVSDILSFAAPLLDLELYTDSEKLLRRCIGICEHLDPDGWKKYWAQSMLGEALLGQNNFGEAGPLLTTSYDRLKKSIDHIPATKRNGILKRSVDRLIRLAEATDQIDDLNQWRAEREQYQ